MRDNILLFWLKALSSIIVQCRNFTCTCIGGNPKLNERRR